MKRRSGIKIMRQLIGLIFPLLPVMILAVILGVLGFLCAIYISVEAVNAILHIAKTNEFSMYVNEFNFSNILLLLLILAVLRGVLHYGEQYCNHFIAFKILAIIRHKIFIHLRKLAPAILEGKDKGNLISLITSDIELLEVFYAHTISPIAIAVITSLIMVIVIGNIDFTAGIITLCAYIAVGVIIPVYMGKKGQNDGMDFRNEVGDLNSLVLDSLRGLDETIQYNNGMERSKLIDSRSRKILKKQKKLNEFEAKQKSITNFTILLFTLIMLIYTTSIVLNVFNGIDSFVMVNINQDSFKPLILLMSSFGPVVALSNLSNNLHHTLASGERVLSLLEEKPLVNEITDGCDIIFENAKVENVCFSYKDELILDNVSLDINKNEVVGIYGPSGSGKSTLLKLLMRFWEVKKGNIKISDQNINRINTESLRKNEAYVTQETYLFNDTIFNNVALGNKKADLNAVQEACKKASVHDFIVSLKDGYQTNVGELGDILSGGEKQRIGMARAFLHDSPLLLLDEPTSNLDSLNEGIILKSLKESKDNKTIVLISHRKSTMSFADRLYSMDSKRNS